MIDAIQEKMHKLEITTHVDEKAVRRISTLHGLKQTSAASMIAEIGDPANFTREAGRRLCRLGPVSETERQAEMARRNHQAWIKMAAENSNPMRVSRDKGEGLKAENVLPEDKIETRSQYRHRCPRQEATHHNPSSSPEE